jgi:hypothetical protein
MRKLFLTAIALSGLVGAGFATHASAASWVDRPPALSSPSDIGQVEYDGWREREWRRRERWEEWRRHEEWRRWHYYRGY